MYTSYLELVATICMSMAVLHTFAAGSLRKFSHHFAKNSLPEMGLHLLSEVELIFAIWALIFLMAFAVMRGVSPVISYVGRLHFGEALFVFTIMTIMSARPILWLAEWLILKLMILIPIPKPASFYFLCLTLGPILGSFITEPAAMTVSALLLYRDFFTSSVSTKFKYATLGALFVNVSIGGTLTHYAAPPVLMVSEPWGWDAKYMFFHFGWKAVASIVVTNLTLMFFFRNELKRLPKPKSAGSMTVVKWVRGLLTLEGSKLKEAALVAVFLAGLVVLGGLQRWWLEPILARLDSAPLFFGSLSLTAIVDNAALTYLASTVTDIAESAKYFIVAGAVVGGGLTVIANAPNPAGNAILGPAFGKDGITAGGLLLGALFPTAVAATFFWLF